MSLGDGSGLSAADIMALAGNNNDGFGAGFGGGWWVILFILLIFGGGWGGRGWGYGGNGGGGNDSLATMAMPYIYGNGVQQGFDQSAVMTALNNLNTAVANGFAAASVDSCNKAMANMQAINGVQMQIANGDFATAGLINGSTNSILTQMGNYEMARQQCCCDSKLQTAQLQATMLAEHCSDRAEVDRAMNALSTQMNAGFQGVYDKMAQQENDALRRENENLRMQAYMNGLTGSLGAQTQQLIANNQAQTDRIMDFMNPPYARPFYGWPQQNPNQCPCGNS